MPESAASSARLISQSLGEMVPRHSVRIWSNSDQQIDFSKKTFYTSLEPRCAEHMDRTKAEDRYSQH